MTNRLPSTEVLQAFVMRFFILGPRTPENQAHYGKPSVFDLAAAYAYGIIRNHPFADGNKRTGFLAAYVFLHSNGWELRAREAEAVHVVLALAAGEMDEPGFRTGLKTTPLYGRIGYNQ